jgi:hypothetical protein
MSPSYIGIDIADDVVNRSRVDLVDDGSVLEVSNIHTAYGNPLAEGERGAVDSPFGYPRAFMEVACRLRSVAVGPQDLKRRMTESLLGHFFAELPFVVEANEAVPHFFNRGRHVQSTVSLEIVPGAILEVIRLLGLSNSQQVAREREIVAARMGDGQLIEAHPRLFLYSALARVRAGLGIPLPVDLLTAAKRYKTPSQPTAEEAAQAFANRQNLLGFLTQHVELWLGVTRGLNAAGVCLRDHDFDAFLCALTALAHHQGQTRRWDTFPEFSLDMVAAEGHIFILHLPVDIGANE